MNYGADNLKMWKILITNWIWPWRSTSIIPQNNMDPNHGVLHLWFKFGDPSLNKRWVIVRTSSWLIHTHGNSDPQTQAMTIPEGQNWPRVKPWNSILMLNNAYTYFFLFIVVGVRIVVRWEVIISNTYDGHYFCLNQWGRCYMLSRHGWATNACKLGYYLLEIMA